MFIQAQSIFPRTAQVCVTQRDVEVASRTCLACVCLLKGRGRQVKRGMEKEERRVAAPSGRLLFLSSCCLRAGGSTAMPCQSLLPKKAPHPAPLHANQEQAALSPWPSFVHPLLLCTYTPHLPLPNSEPFYSNQFQAVKESTLSDSYITTHPPTHTNTHKHTDTHTQSGRILQRGTFQGQALIMKKVYVLFCFLWSID